MSFLRRVLIDQVIHFGKKFGILGKGAFNNKAKSLIEVPYVLKGKKMFMWMFRAGVFGCATYGTFINEFIFIVKHPLPNCPKFNRNG